MKRALVIGAAGGIGGALVDELAARSFDVSKLSRSEGGFDLKDPAALAETLTGLAPFHVVMIATGKLDGAGRGPEKSLKALTAEAMMDQFRVNTVGPALILRQLPQLLSREGDSFCGVLSARVGSIGDNGLGGWYSYRASKAALNQVLRSASIEIARSHKRARLIALHPGTVATDFTSGFPSRDKISPETSARALVEVLLTRSADQSGSFWDWKGTPVPW